MKRSVGNRIFLSITRPNIALIGKFRGIPSSNIGDTMGRLYCTDSSIKPLNSHPLLGCAFTVKVPCGDNMLLHRALDLALPGDILVVDGQGCMERSLAGEIMVHYAISRGIAGIVVDGCLRDLAALREASIPIYCKGITPQGPYKNGPGEINVPVCCGHQVILPGDILVGDEDGIVVIHLEDAEEVLEKSLEKFHSEAQLLEQYNHRKMDYIDHSALYEKKAIESGISYFP